MTLADSWRIGEIEGAGTVELVYVSELIRMGFDSLLMPVRGSVRGEGPL